MLRLCPRRVFEPRPGRPVEPEVLIGAVGSLFEVLSVGSPRAIAAVLDCFVAMLNQHLALVHSLCDLGLFERVVGFLDTPELVGPSLHNGASRRRPSRGSSGSAALRDSGISSAGMS
jgi:hypothetical protein